MKNLIFLTFVLFTSIFGCTTTVVAPEWNKEGVQEFSPDSFHVYVWDWVEGCTGLEGNIEAVTWYTADRLYRGNKEAGGIYNREEHAIYLLWWKKYDEETVSHEVNHALGLIDHNAQDKDGNWTKFKCELKN